jgi:hypothetical protein
VANKFGKGFKQFNKKLETALAKATNRAQATRLANDVVNQIQARTSKGQGVRESGQVGGRGKKLKSLKQSTIDYRERYRNSLARYTSPSTSNLTFSGQLLKSLKARNIKIRKGLSFDIVPVGKRKPSVSGHKKPKASNLDVAGFVSQDRPFLGLTASDVRAVNKKFKMSFSRTMRQVFK